jgi:hypothetical protein
MLWIRIILILFFALIGPFLGLVSFVFTFYFLRLFINSNLMSDDYFSYESISLVYVVGLIPALVVGISASIFIETTGRISPKVVLYSGIIVGFLVSVPFLFFGYDIPPFSLFDRLPEAAMIVWVNVGAATFAWLIWELARRGFGMVWKERKA